MREIKFRAWDNNLKSMINVFTLYNEGTGGVIPQTDQHSSTTGTERYKIMQYTGLLDKHGKEIYEGDILKSEQHQETGLKVVWYIPAACFRYSLNHDLSSPLNYDDIEIIGNIYQHPNLLN